MYDFELVIFIIVFIEERSKSMGNKPFENLICPECYNIGEYEIDDNEEVFCKCCGLLIKSPYPYTGGFKFKTLSDIIDEEKCRRIKNGRFKKLQKI